mgnify:CR=1 FL=1
MSSADTHEALRAHIATLRSEIQAAEAKIPRTIESIRTRKQTLARLEAKLALMDEPHPARSCHE